LIVVARYTVESTTRDAKPFCLFIRVAQRNKRRLAFVLSGADCNGVIRKETVVLSDIEDTFSTKCIAHRPTDWSPLDVFVTNMIKWHRINDSSGSV
jgi:hypothetical protein